jgi:hypothetical protein
MMKSPSHPCKDSSAVEPKARPALGSPPSELLLLLLFLSFVFSLPIGKSNPVDL